MHRVFLLQQALLDVDSLPGATHLQEVNNDGHVPLPSRPH